MDSCSKLFFKKKTFSTLTLSGIPEALGTWDGRFQRFQWKLRELLRCASSMCSLKHRGVNGELRWAKAIQENEKRLAEVHQELIAVVGAICYSFGWTLLATHIGELYPTWRWKPWTAGSFQDLVDIVETKGRQIPVKLLDFIATCQHDISEQKLQRFHCLMRWNLMIYNYTHFFWNRF